MDNKKLIIILAVLLALYGYKTFVDKPVTKSFNAEIVSIDTSLINRIVIPDADDKSKLLTLQKTGSGWTIQKDNLTLPCNATSVQSIVTQGAYIKANRLVAKSSDKWKEYEVDEESGSKVSIYNNEKLLGEFVAGRLNFDQTSRKATSYLRKIGSDDTYAVEGFLTMAFKQGFNSFRRRGLAILNKDDITKISVDGDQSLSLNKTGTQWSIAQTNSIDSIQMSNYLNGIANLNGSKFNDTFDKTTRANLTMSIGANNQLAPLTIKSYTLNDSTFIINSSLSPESYFESDTLGIYQSLFSNLFKLSTQ